jgi:hypothetical protein
MKEFNATMQYAQISDSGKTYDLQDDLIQESTEKQMSNHGRTEQYETAPKHWIEPAVAAPPVVGGQLGLNDINVMMTGGTLSVHALVNAEGWKRLKKILEANASLLEEEDQAEPDVEETEA